MASSRRNDMSTRIAVLLFIVAFIQIPSPTAARALASTQVLGPKRPTSISFYMRIVVQNNTNDFTAVLTAQPSQDLPYSFGKIHTFDNPLTEGPSLTSKNLGRMQGWYGDVGQTSLTLLLAQTATIDTGVYNGTINFFGADPAAAKIKPVPVVGGTGDFSLARGIAETRLVLTENKNHQTVSLFHYDVQLSY